jgi:fumarate reductase subunit C
VGLAVSATGAAAHTPYHPKWYRRRISVWWWLESWNYTRFVLRELTSLGVAFFALVTLWQIRALSRGPTAYARFEARLASPLFVFLDAVAFALVLYHSITWFKAAPSAMAVRIKGKRVPAQVIVAANVAAWLVLSAAVAFMLLRGR